MAGFFKVQASNHSSMDPKTFADAKLMALLQFVHSMQKDFWFDESIVPGLQAPSDSPEHIAAAIRAQHLVDGYLALMSAVCKFFPNPGELQTAVRDLAARLDITILDAMPKPSSDAPH